MNMKSQALFERISRITLYLAVFLIPLWFLPFTQNILEYQKQTLLLLLVFLGVISWLAKSISDGELTFRKTWIHVGVFALLISVGISTIFSKWQYGSFWGLSLDISDSFITLFAFVLLYSLLSNTIRDTKEIFRLLVYLAISGTIVGVFSILQLSGIFVLPFVKVATFNTVGNSNSIAIFVAVLLPMILVLSNIARKLLKWVLWSITGILLLILAALNFSDAWIVFSVGLLVLLVFGMLNLRKKSEFGWVSLPMALLVVALFFMMFNFTLPGSPTTPVEVSPSLGAEFGIVKEVLKDSPIVGSGPGTFAFDYAKFHSSDLNQTIFWGTRFTSGASEFLDFAATKGVLGIFALLSLIAAALYFVSRKLIKQEENQSEDTSWMLQLGVFSSFVGIIAAFALYPANFTLLFLFWVLLGILTVFAGGKLQKISIAPPSSLALLSSFVFLIVLIFGLGTVFIGAQKYAGEVQYLKGLRASQAGDSDSAITSIISAAGLNSSIDTYWRDLAQLYLNRVTTIGADDSLAAEERQQLQQVAIQNAVASANQAVVISPENVANWNVQGFIYRNLIGIAGAEEGAISAYEKAVELEPASPFSITELGRVYFLQAQRVGAEDFQELHDESLTKALEKLNVAVELKNDYSAARFLIATVLEEQGQISEAIAELEKANVISPNDSGLAFQLGLVYYRQDRLTDARNELERAKQINPEDSNTKYMLGLVYSRQARTSDALLEFEAVLELNPENTEVQSIIENLRTGKAALNGIISSTPPVEEEGPAEIGVE